MADTKVDDGRWVYDVFLSFKGDDTRKNFTDHLYHALRDVGIHVFRDDNELRRGEDISKELEQAIQTSNIAIIAFSKNYADSRWCLEELVKIMECKRTHKQVVLPLFYDVDPTDVRNQKGSFEDAFARHQQRFVSDKDKVLRWRSVLTEAANLSGFNLKNIADGHEGKFIKKIVRKVLRDLNKKIDIAQYQVGIRSRVNAITSELDVGSSGVRMVGIWGMRGLGKTTIAKAAYNQLCSNFDGACFLGDVKDASKESNGLVRLQEKLLEAIFKSSKIELQNVAEGITQLQQRLHHKKVLLILDDVDDMEQLKALARSSDMFGEGSRIIITTVDEHLLKILKVDAICTVDEMSEFEGLELFSWHAFRNSCPYEDFNQLSESVVKYCKGLPLALEVLGCFLHGRMVPEWEDTLRKLKTIPHYDIQKKLEISYDGLKDQTYKDIFLDISCFFIGMDKNDVIQIMEGCGLFPTIGISVLLQRCLLKVDYKNKLVMHNLLRDMGRKIVLNESPKERSRLFVNDDVLFVLEKQKKYSNKRNFDSLGTDVIEGLSLKLSKASNNKILNTEAFSGMQKLRFLQLNYAGIQGDFKHFSQELRWLCWHGYALEFLPEDFNLEKVVVIDFRYSRLTKFFRKEPKQFSLEKLTVLNLSHSHDLKCTPNFLKLPSLEKLKLKDCKSLVKVDDSIGSLKKLLFINLKDCASLNKLPETLSELKSLEKLIFSGCSKLKNLPKDLGKMESLVTLEAKESGIQELPSTIVGLKKLKYLSISRCEGPPSTSMSLAEILWSFIFPSNFLNSIVLPSLRGLESLTVLNLGNCNLSDNAIPEDIGSLVSLESLNLGGNDFHCLPASINQLSKLRILCLDDCSKLEQISNLPPYLESLQASRCKSLESISNLPKTEQMLKIRVNSCSNLAEISGLDKLFLPKRDRKFVLIYLRDCSKLKQSFTENISQKMLVKIDEEITQIISHGVIVEKKIWPLTLDASQIPDFDEEQSVQFIMNTDGRTWYERIAEAPSDPHLLKIQCEKFNSLSLVLGSLSCV